MNEEKKCKHQYEAKVTKRQDLVKMYLTDAKYSINVLEQEVITIFCVHCGDAHVINESVGIVDENK